VGCRPQPEARLVYFLAAGQAGLDQLYRLELDRGEPQAITAAALGVHDFAPQPGGGAVIFSAWREDGGSDLWRWSEGGPPELALACPAATCRAPVWLPDSTALLYERQPLADSSGPRLYWLNADEGTTRPLFDDVSARGQAARWSADGAWLSYVAPADGHTWLYRPNDALTMLIESGAGQPAAWSPDSRWLVLPALAEQGERIGQRLLRLEPAAGPEAIELSAEPNIEAGSPAFSPDGVYIAFGRKVARATTGQQLWLMRADGSEPQPLTAEPDFYHGPPRWSADGRYLLCQRYRINAPAEPAEIWLLEVATGATRRLAVGYAPEWG
jgi:Tol biopolymer transport system component